MSEAASCRERLMERGFDCPEWGDVARGLQPGQVLLDDSMPGVARRGWQRGAAQHIEDQFRTGVMSQLELHEQAMFRSQSGPLVGVPFICTPKSPETRFEPPLPCVASQTPLVSFTLVCCKLPVWPSTRSLWPPPRSLPACRGSGTAGVPVGERSSTRLSRSRSTRFDQCSCAGHGPPSA